MGRTCVNCGKQIYQSADPNDIKWYHREDGCVPCARPVTFARPAPDNVAVESSLQPLPESESISSSTLAEIKESLDTEYADLEGYRARLGAALGDLNLLLAIIDSLKNQEWTAERVIAWMDDPQRKPAMHAFTAGNERQIAYRYERALSDIADMKAELIKRVREKADLHGEDCILTFPNEGGVCDCPAAKYGELATELEAVQLNQQDSDQDQKSE